jgi:DNA primase
MSSDQISEIKSRLSIIEVLSDYVQLKKAGVNYKANCPFHKEKTPSFMVTPVKQIWHCFGCGVGGDIFEFIKLIENVEFSQALKILADKAGVELKKPTVSELRLKDTKDLLKDINQQASVYFQKVLLDTNAGKEAHLYLKDRGLSEQTIRRWQLGFAPDDFHYLENFLSKKYAKQDIVSAGLLIKKDDGSYYDRFRGRIMFPIKNIQGEVVGFTGRILKADEKTGKYINSPETDIYNKSEVIYGLDQAKSSIRKENRAILVEGNMDVIACHQAGFVNTIASSGTALTSRQLEVLSRLTENLYFAFDADAAGIAAAKRALEGALSLGFNVKVVDMKGHKDPDEMIKKSIGLWQKAVDSAPHYVEFFLEHLLKANDPDSVDGKRQISREIIPLISRIPDAITKAHYARKLSLSLNVSEQSVWDMLNKAGVLKPAQPSGSKEIALPKKDRLSMLEENLLGLSLLMRTKEQLQEIKPDDFSEERRELARAIFKEKSADPENLKKNYPNLAIQIDLFVFSAQVEAEERMLDPEKQIKSVYLELKKHLLKNRMQEISSNMARAEKEGNNELAKKLASEFSAIGLEISKIPE